MSWRIHWNERALTRALKDGTFDQRDGEGATPLWHAVYFGRADWVERLLAAGAGPRRHDQRRIDRLGGGGHTVSIWRRLPDGASRVRAGRATLLHAAGARKAAPAEVAELLLDRGVPLEGRDRFGCTALHVAASAGALVVVRLLLERGADPNAEDRAGFVALDHAGNKIEVVRALLRGGAQPDGGEKVAGTSPAGTALELAADGGDEELLDLLLEAGADLRRHPEALARAAWRGRPGTTRRLLEAGADVDHEVVWRSAGRPALEAAAMYASLPCLRVLLPACAHQRDRALRAAVAFDQDDTPEPPNDRQRARREAVDLLLEAGADPGAALPEAARAQDEAYARQLLEAGADPDALDPDGWTTLHHAARAGQRHVAALLLAAGADPRAATPQGWTAFSLAEEAYRKQGIDDARLVMNALRAAGAAPEPRTPGPATPSPGIRSGGRVTHKVFGEGKVLGVAGEGEEAKITVAFARAGRKVLLARFLRPV